MSDSQISNAEFRRKVDRGLKERIKNRRKKAIRPPTYDEEKHKEYRKKARDRASYELSLKQHPYKDRPTKETSLEDFTE